ncbi:MAG: tRNA 5-methoxyuridine(34)/uridine 5-oxyacetic acid(34) synthase CmoB [Endozoicomonadaceae bacterium]|nr:tRNA 5-methoxyuridine(34)/uridine 5-oxyacetic acid(34) synthase CmoB [Endozoicomonadaceae bacterium]MBE8233078.1 tRNA 5-methoxyuridine(34)/uridine 5-oxyacetic acid(34) synthase CmoB [Endozoicomonadaceae bacterium]
MTVLPFCFTAFFEWLQTSDWSNHQQVIEHHLYQRLSLNPPGDMEYWCQAIRNLPLISVDKVTLNTDAPAVTTKQTLFAVQKKQLNTNLMALKPWRKGPFSFFETMIDSEWRSNLKWNRIASHLDDLSYRTVVDIGCGSGYHAWRLLGDSAKRVIGVDPSILFLSQFTAFKKYAGDALPIDFLPMKLDDLPYHQAICETALSMGVLYHQRSPITHLEQMFSIIKPKGQLILETLIIEGDKNTVLMPHARYAAMRNVWFIPSIAHLIIWLTRVGFESIQIIDITATSCEEQRSTDWMTFHSLANYLNPEDATQTIEGYHAPLRAVLKAKKPKN